MAIVVITVAFIVVGSVGRIVVELFEVVELFIVELTIGPAVGNIVVELFEVVELFIVELSIGPAVGNIVVVEFDDVEFDDGISVEFDNSLVVLDIIVVVVEFDAISAIFVVDILVLVVGRH